MYDCVFPTRTARFGNALTRNGPLKLKHLDYEQDQGPIEAACTCYTCKTHTRAYLSRLIRQRETAGCHLISIHNIAYQMRLMKDIRESIVNDKFPEFVQIFMKQYYHQRQGHSSLAGSSATNPPIDQLEGEDGASDDDPGKALTTDGYPQWIVNALESVNITLLPK